MLTPTTPWRMDDATRAILTELIESHPTAPRPTIAGMLLARTGRTIDPRTVRRHDPRPRPANGPLSPECRSRLVGLILAGGFPSKPSEIAKRFRAETGRAVSTNTIRKIANGFPRSDYAPTAHDDRWRDDGSRAPMDESQRSLASDPAALAMARKIAAAFARRCPGSFEDDIHSAAMYGLMRAALNHDPARPEPFTAFARHHVRGEIRATLGKIPRFVSLDCMGGDGVSMAHLVPFTLGAAF